MKTLDADEEIHKEIAFLLHCHNRENPGQLNELKDAAKDIDPQNDSFNQNVMAVLIEDGYLRELMRNQEMYPKFLTAMLRDDVGDDIN